MDYGSSDDLRGGAGLHLNLDHGRMGGVEQRLQEKPLELHRHACTRTLVTATRIRLLQVLTVFGQEPLDDCHRLDDTPLHPRRQAHDAGSTHQYRPS